MSKVYKNPRYYEIAFSFRDISAEVDVVENVIQQYSGISVSKMLELGCGHSPYLEELTRRGYQYIGLDLSREMIKYAQKKADAINESAIFHLSDMTDFQLESQVDFAFILLGSLLLEDTKALISHFDCVGRALKPGGLYLLDWCVNFAPNKEEIQSWEIVEDNVKVKTTYSTKPINTIEQLTEDVLILEVEDGGEKKVFREASILRKIYPQEFLLFISNRSDFEYIGWWNNWDLDKPLDGTKEISRPITVLRRL